MGDVLAVTGAMIADALDAFNEQATKKQEAEKKKQEEDGQDQTRGLQAGKQMLVVKLQPDKIARSMHGLVVQYAWGSKCEQSQQLQQSTTLYLVCDSRSSAGIGENNSEISVKIHEVFRSVGQPERVGAGVSMVNPPQRGGQAGGGAGRLRGDGCEHVVVWRSSYACPQCTSQHFKKMTGPCTNGTRTVRCIACNASLLKVIRTPRCDMTWRMHRHIHAIKQGGRWDEWAYFV